MDLKDLPSLSETVRKHDLYANKSLGQHFLLDMNLTDKIARLADPLDDVHITEIGPCLLYTSPSPRDKRQSRMPSSA